MRRIIVTAGALMLLGGCVVHERAPYYRTYGYAPAPYYGPHRSWRAEERHERHEAREHEEHEEHEHGHW